MRSRTYAFGHCWGTAVTCLFFLRPSNRGTKGEGTPPQGVILEAPPGSFLSQSLGRRYNTGTVGSLAVRDLRYSTADAYAFYGAGTCARVTSGRGVGPTIRRKGGEGTFMTRLGAETVSAGSEPSERDDRTLESLNLG